MRKLNRRVILQVLGLVFLMAGSQMAHAVDVTIVALGGSQTYGKKVSRGSAYPAQMQKLLHQQGVQAVVINAGRKGVTTTKLLSDLGKSVPSGTKIVILQPGGADKRNGITRGQRKANMRAIRRQLKSRGIKIIMMKGKVFKQLRQTAAYKTGRRGKRISAAGYHELARQYAGKVMAALQK